MSALATSPELVDLGRDGRGEARLTTRDMLSVEDRLDRSSNWLSEQRSHPVSDGARLHALTSSTR